MLRFLRLIRVFQEDVVFLVLPEFFPWLNYIPAPLMRRLSRQDWLQKSAKQANDMMQVSGQLGQGEQEGQGHRGLQLSLPAITTSISVSGQCLSRQINKKKKMCRKLHCE